VLRRLGIALVPWAPLGTGFLSGTVQSVTEGDWRTNNPKYSAENLAANRARFAPLIDIANELGITPAQLALAWLLHQGSDIIPIPGSRRAERVSENVAATGIMLTAEVLARIEAIATPGRAAGATLV
jgi:aryl-alcohol dehydrogenase-like predicted oxidoreductase